MEENQSLSTDKGIKYVAVEVPRKRPKPKTCPLKHSNFFITINTQKNIHSMTDKDANELKENFKLVIHEFFYEKLKDFIDMSGSKLGEGYGLPRILPREELEKRIEEATCEFVLEIGPSSGKLHAHGMLCLAKRGLDTKLNFEKIREFINSKMGFVCHFQCQLFRDAKKNLEEYIKKAPTD